MKKGLRKVIVGFMTAMVLSMGCATVCMAEESCNHSWFKKTEYVYQVLCPIYDCPIIDCNEGIVTATTEEFVCRKCGETIYLHWEDVRHKKHP